MKLSVFAGPAAFAPSATVPSFPLPGFVGRFVEGWRAARADRQANDDLGHLDGETLRDIGVEPDEISRLHAGQKVLPRTWRA